MQETKRPTVVDGSAEDYKASIPAVREERPAPAPARTGACPYCMRKHILKARGYARELREDGTREWERENLLENLLLAEDHAEALGDAGFKAAIREARLIVEDGGLPDMEPLLARAREKILGPRSVDGVGEVLKETTPAPTKTEN